MRLCKEKRLKCDETKPECQNCTNRDRKCPGYNQVYRWKAKCQTNMKSFDPTLRKKDRAPRRSTHQTSKRDLSSKKHSRINEVQADTPQSTLEEIHADNEEIVNANSGPVSDEPADLLHNFVDLDGLSVSQMFDESHDDFPPVMQPLSFRGFEQQPHFPALLGGSGFIIPARSEVQAMTTPYNDSRPGRRTDVRSLLAKFYSTSPKLTYPLVHQATKLVEHYFSTVCAVYSCFDSFLNPFRYNVSEQWSHSASTYYAIQSMAAAHLANELPFMRSEAVELHRKASQHLGQELTLQNHPTRNNEQALLSLLLLGLSACWQRAGDLGVGYLRTARTIMYANLNNRERKRASKTEQMMLQFFEEALVYWEMVTSFVADESDIDLQPQACPQIYEHEAPTVVQETNDIGATSDHSALLPHPWTGINPESQMLLGQVGRLVRQVRCRHQYLDDQANYMYLALELEEQILAIELPQNSTMTDCGDGFTQNSDLITLAEMTRDAGLLELYRVFPELLQQRLPCPGWDTGSDISSNSPSTSSSSDRQSWLTSLAIHILRRLESIPETSNVRCHQLLLLVIAASELRFPPRPGLSEFQFSERDAEIHSVRKFVRARLHQLAAQLPSQPIYVILELITEVWRRVDGSRDDQQPDDVFWVDLMIEKGWQTIMG